MQHRPGEPIYAAGVDGYETPEEAVRATDSAPPEYVRIIAVEYSPDRSHAVVLIEYNEPPAVEPYIVLCERTGAAWVAAHGTSGGGSSWMSTTEDGSLGVEVLWGPSRYVIEWN